MDQSRVASSDHRPQESPGLNQFFELRVVRHRCDRVIHACEKDVFAIIRAKYFRSIVLELHQLEIAGNQVEVREVRNNSGGLREVSRGETNVLFKT